MSTEQRNALNGLQRAAADARKAGLTENQIQEAIKIPPSKDEDPTTAGGLGPLTR